tara:strand:- start:53267 stop:53788 length:522 start_codon:yes stop_codon:yes gene_type:complete
MAILLDKLVPPIIVGLLIIMIFRLNAFMMESQVDNRLSNEMQTFSELASTIIQEEMKTANNIVTLSTNSIVYDTIDGIRVTMERVDNHLVIKKVNQTTLNEIVIEHPAYLSSLEFTAEPSSVPLNQIRFINVKLTAESNPIAHVNFNGDIQTAKSFSERQIYLRNVVAASLQL